MNVHRCPQCGRDFWCRANLGELERLPKHKPRGLKIQCPGSRTDAPAIKPPGLSS